MHVDRSMVAAIGFVTKPAAGLTLATLLLAAVPGVAGAANAEIVHDHYADRVSLTADEFCGFPVEDDFEVNTIWHFSADGSFSATGSHVDTYINPANGKLAVARAAGPFILGPRIVDVRAGTYSVTVSFKGLGINVIGQPGGSLLRDAGLLSFTDTFLLATDEKIATTVVVKGPHPDADSGFSLFCDAMRTALS